MGTSTDALDPDLRQGLQELLQLVGQNGLQARITSTVRTYREQKFLWDRYQQGKAEFPAAPPGHSAHEYGWAFDLVVSPYDYQTAVGAAWQKYWGGTYGGQKDPVHFELPGASQRAFQLGEEGQQPPLSGGPGFSFTPATDKTPDLTIWDYLGYGLSFSDALGILFELGYAATSEDEAVKLMKLLHIPRGRISF